MALENNQIEGSNIDNDEISLKDFFIKIKAGSIFLKTKWKTIFIAGFIGALIGLTIAFFEKPIYKAVLTFAMEEDKGSGGGGISSALGLASSFGIDLGGAGGGGAFAASNLAELMKSHYIITKVLLSPIKIKNDTISLADYYIEVNNLKSKWRYNPFLKNIKFPINKDIRKLSLQQDSILKIIHKTLLGKQQLSIAQKDKKVTIIFVEVTSKDELFSKVFCENLVKETSKFYIETKTKKASMNVAILQKQVDSIKYELNIAISGVASETDNVYNLNPAYNLKAAPSKRRQIDVQANTAILTNLVVQLELAKITLRKETPLIQIIDFPTFPLEKDKIGKILSVFLGIFIVSLITIIYLLICKMYNKIIS